MGQDERIGRVGCRGAGDAPGDALREFLRLGAARRGRRPADSCPGSVEGCGARDVGRPVRAAPGKPASDAVSGGRYRAGGVRAGRAGAHYANIANAGHLLDNAGGFGRCGPAGGHGWSRAGTGAGGRGLAQEDTADRSSGGRRGASDTSRRCAEAVATAGPGGLRAPCCLLYGGLRRRRSAVRSNVRPVLAVRGAPATAGRLSYSGGWEAAGRG